VSHLSFKTVGQLLISRYNCGKTLRFARTRNERPAGQAMMMMMMMMNDDDDDDE